MRLGNSRRGVFTIDVVESGDANSDAEVLFVMHAYLLRCQLLQPVSILRLRQFSAKSSRGYTVQTCRPCHVSQTRLKSIRNENLFKAACCACMHRRCRCSFVESLNLQAPKSRSSRQEVPALAMHLPLSGRRPRQWCSAASPQGRYRRCWHKRTWKPAACPGLHA